MEIMILVFNADTVSKEKAERYNGITISKDDLDSMLFKTDCIAYTLEGFVNAANNEEISLECNWISQLDVKE